MLLHAQRGDRAGALRVDHQCVSALAQELGVEPGPDTRTLYERILNHPGAYTTAPQSADSFPLVDREEAWQTLLAAWQAAPQAGPSLVLIRGEAGIGKTRLAEELLRWVEGHHLPTASTRAYAAEGRLAYAPIAAWLRTDAYRERLARLEDVWLAELARVLPELLAQRPDLPAPQPLTESWQRQRLFEAIAHAILLDARPSLLHIDDLQWCDGDTLECLHYLLRRDPRAPLLVLGTARDEEVDGSHPLAPWLDRLRPSGRLVEIELTPLTQTAVSELAGEVAGHRLTASEIEVLYRQTEGNPLFVVEMVRAGLVLPAAQPAADDSAGVYTLPPRVKAILHACSGPAFPPGPRAGRAGRGDWPVIHLCRVGRRQPLRAGRARGPPGRTLAAPHRA